MVEYLFINFKTYEQSTGANATKLAKLMNSFAQKKVEIIPVVQAIDLKEVASNCSLKIFAQHIDPINYGSNTGKILPEAIKQAGAYGTVLNHAENKVSNEFLEKAVKRGKEVGLKIMLCAESIERAKQLAKLNPDLIAVEPPELIGGDISVSTAQPELIEDSVKAIHEINPKIQVITGAGVKNSADVKKAIELGTKGVFVASGIICSKNKKEAIRELLSGFE